MPYERHPDPDMSYSPLPTYARRSAISSPHHQDAGHGDPSELFIPHVDPEDEEGLFEHHPVLPERVEARSEKGARKDEAKGEHEPPGKVVNETVLTALITEQARSVGVDLIEHHRQQAYVSFPIERIQTVRDLFGQLGPGTPDEPNPAVEALKKLIPPLDARLVAILDPGPSNLERSASLYLHLRKVFDHQIVNKKIVDENVPWPVPGGPDASLRTVGGDLEEYYRLVYPSAFGAKTRAVRERGSSLPSPIVRHSVDGVLTEVEILRARMVCRIVNLHDDWRMFLAWLQTGNPALCLGWMNENLARPKGGKIDGCYDPKEIEPDRARRAFLVTGYEIKDLEDFRTAVLEVANGARSHRNMPIWYRLRNSYDPQWGNKGHAWIRHEDFAHQFGLGYGLLLPESQLPGA
jgi:hypothetical protein